MKKNLLITIIIIFIGVFTWINAPMEFLKRNEIKRGNELVLAIENYLANENRLPNNGEWDKLKAIGLTEKEINTSYPEYQKIDSSTFELIYVEGFDPPYLIWNSNERKWKEGNPTYLKNKN